MKNKKNILYLFILIGINVYSQQKDPVDICSLISEQASVMAFQIPSKKCEKKFSNLLEIKKRVSSEFKVNANIIRVSEYSINKYSVIEALYETPLCDTVAVFFVTKKGAKILHSKSYKADYSKNGFRVYENRSMLILYREVRLKKKLATLSFEINKAKYKLDTFVDDGFSIW